MEKIQQINYKELKSERVSDFDTVYIIEPLMRGFANTIGTVIRRTLLSSITSAAPFAIKINNVKHEYETIEGIKEDVITLISNIRKIRFTYTPEAFGKDNLAKISFKTNKEGEIFASDIEGFLTTGGIEIINKDQYICTITKKQVFEFDLFLRTGRGYIDFEENKNTILEYGPKLESKIKNGQFIAIDSDFSPVKRCAIKTEELNTSSKTIEERLRIELVTDKTVDCDEAMEQAAKIIIAHFQIIGNIDAKKTIELFDENKVKKEKTKQVSQTIEKLNLTIRSLNALRRAGYETIEELIKLTDDDLANIKNLGKKSVEDIIQKIHDWKEKHLDEDEIKENIEASEKGEE
ncbi:DNA-directed RNA polymerase subunit alpha [Metamycoplasma subdolum]|uniref:DNA-directed RNA polymerase subunit alpha n=1 Tax=Metamycoplasma subdolum TaxID=92407 RepID=A0A3M0A1D7_9BACT|nr:DNA-directed RNA polymerase subunit alpha [Metamycoplasma subdolum]RMA78600.1 DNA-directed RNA polymerase subunit alpha [Metamycoplasma subdolum]WPB50264.1 DNA-directed RNA polymerase subunit alpha [Metamycoplasma subdolum]